MLPFKKLPAVPANTKLRRFALPSGWSSLDNTFWHLEGTAITELDQVDPAAERCRELFRLLYVFDLSNTHNLSD